MEGEYDGITVLESDSEEEVAVIDEESVTTMRRRLEEKREGIRRTTSRSSVCIYRIPQSLVGINPKSVQPEMVSIGPYHRGKEELLEFESHKWWFLDALLSRTSITKGLDLRNYFKAMKQLEESARRCYSEFIPMSSTDFVEMMVLDGCFIIELFRHVCKSEDVIDDNDPILSMPWLIPILIRDLLKLENQLPFFVLEALFDLSKNPSKKGDPLVLLAMKFFNLSLPRPIQVLKRSTILEGKHLLDLFHLSFLPPITLNDSQKYRPSSQSIQCATQLRPSGIKFRPHRTDSFLEINFKNRVLQIPPITINDFTITIFINCIAFEQCHQYNPTCFTTYIAFMSCLINSNRDVTFLCGDGIITGFSQNDQNVARLFRKLGEEVVFNIRDCYLSKQFRDVDAYYSSHWANFVRTYFSSPWSFISVFSALILLVLTGVQTAMSILSYVNKRS